MIEIPEITIAGESVVLSHYKEPLRPLPLSVGFGFYGTLAETKSGDGVQCHLCGKLFTHLAAHIQRGHKITTKAYKEQFGLAGKTALSCEQYRQTLKQRTLHWLSLMTDEEKKAYQAKRIIAARANGRKATSHGFKQTLETKNKRGTCPDQLLDRLQKVAEKIGHTPTVGEFIRETNTQGYLHRIRATFGTFSNALKMAKLEPRKRTLPRGKDSREWYSDDELLEHLKIYVETYGRVPTGTDCRKGLLPHMGFYVRRFGSLVRAREFAGIKTPPRPRGSGATYPPITLDYLS